jgi:hypothetical protein
MLEIKILSIKKLAAAAAVARLGRGNPRRGRTANKIHPETRTKNEPAQRACLALPISFPIIMIRM